jgi:hypothetical protein|tara:strand:- start:53 stop:634 length:582 start_codon:yes stop_codon:yes gene_type:complete
MDDNFDGVEVYDNVYPIDFCKQVIKRFEELSSMQMTAIQQQGIDRNQDERIYMDWANHNSHYHADEDLCKFFFETLNKTYLEKYKTKYESLGLLFQHTAKGMSVQKTKPHQGYHAWHCENADVPTSTRVLAYTLYLNGVEEGGETEFLYQGHKIKPAPGRLAIFPTSFTHPHRGNPIYKGVKYIISGWYTLDH